MHNPNICKTFSGPSSSPMDCIICCLSRALLQIYPAWCSARLEGRSTALCLGGMFSNFRLAQSMHRHSHVNGVQGKQKRILDKRHECVCYFWVCIQCSQCISLPILRKGISRPIAAIKTMEFLSGTGMHLWGPNCFYNCVDRYCLKPFARTKTN